MCLHFPININTNNLANLINYFKRNYINLISEKWWLLLMKAESWGRKKRIRTRFNTSANYSDSIGNNA